MPKSIDASWSDDEVDVIYKAYPRHVAPIAAKKAIRKALTRILGRTSPPVPLAIHAAAYLLERTLIYSNSPAGKRGKFTPHPATWFNRGSYDEDEAEWQVGDTQTRGLPPRPDKYEGL